MTVRKPQRSDASSIAALSIEVWIGTYLKWGINKHFADYVLAEFTPARIEALISDPDQFMLISGNEDGIDGYIRVSVHCSAPVAGCSDIEISTLYVQPQHQGRGIGKRLLDAALRNCAEGGIKSVWLTTNSENANATAFYLHQGFEEVGVTHFQIAGQAYPNLVLRRALV